MKTNTRAIYLKRFQSVLKYIDEYLQQDLDVNTLAEVALMSPYHFHRVYRQMMNETVNSTVKRLRLQFAASQLLRSESPVLSIAKRINYGSAEAFDRAFEKRYGESPHQFRERCKERYALMGND